METRRRRKDGTNTSATFPLDETTSSPARPSTLDGTISNTGKHKPLGENLEGSILSTGRYYLDEPTARTELADRPEIGSSCRDCINFFYGLHLVRSDCKYPMHSDGHRRLGVCAYCGKMRPIVEGLTMSGKMKTIGKMI